MRETDQGPSLIRWLGLVAALALVLLGVEPPHGESLPLRWELTLSAPGQDVSTLQRQPDSAWQPLTQGVAGIGFSRQSLWLRTHMKADEAQPYLLELDNPRLDHATLYVLRENGEIRTLACHAGQPCGPGSLAGYHNQVFDFDATHSGERFDLYLRVEAARPLIVWPRVFADAEFRAQSFSQRLWLGAYGGVFFGLSLLTLLVWGATRDRDYGAFLAFLASSGLLQAHLLGFLHTPQGSLLPPDFVSVLLPALTDMAYLLLARRILDLGRISPRTDRFLRALTAACALLPVMLLLAGPALTMPMVFIMSSIAGFAGLGAGLVGLWRGARAANLYLIANAFLGTGAMLHMGTAFGVLASSPLTLNAFALGTALCALMVAFALADKVWQLRHSELRAQDERLAAEQRNVELLRESEQRLERAVAERTAQLEAALALQQQQREALEAGNRRLTELDADRSAFLQIAAHDLKNPTAAIISYSDLLRERWHAWDEEKKLRRVGNIRSLAQLSFDIIRALLDINAIESGHYLLRPVRLNASEQLHSVIDAWRERCAAKDLTLSLAEPEQPVWVHADKTAVHQLLENLLSNAVKFSPPGRRIELRLDIESGQALFQFRDEGPGLSEADQARLFQKFTRLSARPTAGEHSTGLGLSIVKYVAEASGGTVGCLSRLGEGASFYFTLPLAT